MKTPQQMKILNKITSRFFCCFCLGFLSIAVFAQNREYPDSIIAKNFYTIFLSKNTYSTSNYIFDLELSEKQAKKIAKISLKNLHGWDIIFRHPPMIAYKIDHYWILWSRRKHYLTRRAPGYHVIINSKSGKVELISYSRR